MNTIAKNPVGNIVRDFPASARVFASYGIDFCCGGKKPLEDVCEQKGIDTGEVVKSILNNQNSGTGPVPRFNQWSPAFLCDYIENNHHAYVKAMLPVIKQWTNKVARVHGELHPETVEIAASFDRLVVEMMNHLEKEEKQAFPLIRKVCDDQSIYSPEPARKLQQLIEEMEEEHDGAGSIMHKIREISNDFQPPEGACNTFKASYEALEDFEKDLHQHVHLENNILFPNAQALCGEVQQTG